MIEISFRDVSRRMDTLYRIESLRNLLARFRYPNVLSGQLPPSIPSFAYCGKRVLAAEARVEFLHLNTWLLAATLDLRTFLKSTTQVTRLVQCLSLSFADVLARLLATVSSDKVCDALFPPIASVCGVSVNPANNVCKAAGSLAELAATVIGKLGDDLDAVLDLFEIPVEIAIDVILELAGLNPKVTLTEKPERDARASEIGKEVFQYDWVSLCEVWDASRRDRILEAGPAVTSYAGPPGPQPGEWQALGSGMLVFSTKWPLAAPAAHVYKTAGVQRTTPGGCDFGAFVDSDLWAKKGVQLTTLDLGIGKIDLYSTHLYSGGDMANLPFIGLNEPSGAEKAAVRAAQVDELASFIGSTHDPRHVAVIAGDFNIPSGSAEYTEFIDRLQNVACAFPGFQGHTLRFDDWWAIDPFRKHPVPLDARGHTNRHGDGGGEIFDTFDSICKVYPPNESRPGTQNQNDYYCDDRKVQDQKATGDRIDFILVECQTPLHGFVLDVSRVRRRAFKRTNAQPVIETPIGPLKRQVFLSDHLGLEVTFFANPPHQPA